MLVRFSFFHLVLTSAWFIISHCSQRDNIPMFLSRKHLLISSIILTYIYASTQTFYYINIYQLMSEQQTQNLTIKTSVL